MISLKNEKFLIPTSHYSGPIVQWLAVNKSESQMIDLFWREEYSGINNIHNSNPSMLGSLSLPLSFHFQGEKESETERIENLLSKIQSLSSYRYEWSSNHRKDQGHFISLSYLQEKLQGQTTCNHSLRWKAVWMQKLLQILQQSWKYFPPQENPQSRQRSLQFVP